MWEKNLPTQWNWFKQTELDAVPPKDLDLFREGKTCNIHQPGGIGYSSGLAPLAGSLSQPKPLWLFLH